MQHWIVIYLALASCHPIVKGAPLEVHEPCAPGLNVYHVVRQIPGVDFPKFDECVAFVKTHIPQSKLGRVQCHLESVDA